MTEEFRRYEQNIKKKHRFSFWSLKYQEQFRTNLNQTVFIPIAVQTFEKLGWTVIFQNETSCEAKRKNDWETWTEKISVVYDQGMATVKSVSLGNEIWDNGRNSKRVTLFIHAFQKTQEEFDSEALKKLEEEVIQTRNWDDYEIPEKLPLPKKSTKPKFWIPIVGAVITSSLLGFLVAYFSAYTMYIIGLYELAVALVIGFALKNLIKLSNYTHYNHLNYLLIAMVVITYVSNQYFQYQIFLNKYNYEPFGFLQFMKLRIEEGLTIQSLNTGSIGLIVSWGLQIWLTYLIGSMRLASNLIVFQIKRVPVEVTDFAYYHFIKGKTEDQVRTELAYLGWKTQQNQNEVFESIAAIHGATEMSRL